MRMRTVYVEVERGEIWVQHDRCGRMFPALCCSLSGSYFGKFTFELGGGEYSVVAVDDSAGSWKAIALSHELR
jgi:hypothetical protein